MPASSHPTPPAEAWQPQLAAWLEPFSQALANKKRRHWAPVYLQGLLGPGERKSIEPIAERLAPGDHDQLNHFVNQSAWDPEPLRRILVAKADRLAGGPDAWLVVDDTALVKKGTMSVGVSHQYCGELGKKANCQALVSLTLARGEVPIPVGLRLFVPKTWAEDPKRRRACGVPEEIAFEEKWRIALAEIDRVREAGARFGVVLADAGYGMGAEFRSGLRERGLVYTVGIPANQLVYPAEVRVAPPAAGPRTGRGRPRKHGVPDKEAVSVEAFIAGLGARAFRKVTWRRGTKGPLAARFCAVRVRLSDGARVAGKRRLPGDEVWLVCEERAGGERRYYVSNLPADAKLGRLAEAVKARWVCEQGHQQMKQELGLDHFEGRSWLGLHHHTVLTMIAFCFLQHLRLGGKKEASCGGENGPAA